MNVSRTLFPSRQVILVNLTILVCSLCTSCKRGPSDEQKAWALATTAILFERNNLRHDILAGTAQTDENIEEWKEILSEWWSITNREDLLNRLKGLHEIGHRERFETMGRYATTITEKQYKEMLSAIPDEQEKHAWETVVKYWHALGDESLVGWDYCRYIALCRWGYLVGYMTEEETWDSIMPPARLLQKTFDSWEDLGENYLIGREFWSFEQMQKNGYLYYQAHHELLDNPESPWNRILWHLKLD